MTIHHEALAGTHRPEGTHVPAEQRYCGLVTPSHSICDVRKVHAQTPQLHMQIGINCAIADVRPVPQERRCTPCETPVNDRARTHFAVTETSLNCQTYSPRSNPLSAMPQSQPTNVCIQVILKGRTLPNQALNRGMPNSHSPPSEWSRCNAAPPALPRKQRAKANTSRASQRAPHSPSLYRIGRSRGRALTRVQLTGSAPGQALGILSTPAALLAPAASHADQSRATDTAAKHPSRCRHHTVFMGAARVPSRVASRSGTGGRLPPRPETLCG